MFRLSGFWCKATSYPGSSLTSVSSPQSYPRHCLLSLRPQIVGQVNYNSQLLGCALFFFPNQQIHTKRMPCNDRDTQGGKWPYEAGGWDWSFVTMNQGTPGVTRSWKRNVRILPRELRERLAPLPPWFQTSRLRSSERVHFPASPHPVCDSPL